MHQEQAPAQAVEQIPGTGTVVVIGGTTGLGQNLAAYYAGQGRAVVISGRDRERAQRAAEEIGRNVAGTGLNLTRPGEIGSALTGIGPVERLALCAFFRDQNTAGTSGSPPAGMRSPSNWSATPRWCTPCAAGCGPVPRSCCTAEG